MERRGEERKKEEKERKTREGTGEERREKRHSSQKCLDSFHDALPQHINISEVSNKGTIGNIGLDFDEISETDDWVKYLNIRQIRWIVFLSTEVCKNLLKLSLIK
jgi:hypothetical protein